MNRIDESIGIAGFVCLVLSACGGGSSYDPDATVKAAVAEATAYLDAAKGQVSNAYAAGGNKFPYSANPPIPTTPPTNAKYVKAVSYSSSGSGPASIVVGLGGTGNTDVDGTFLAMFGTGNTDGTVTWTCGTAGAATATAAAAVIAMYPYLPAPCQH